MNERSVSGPRATPGHSEEMLEQLRAEATRAGLLGTANHPAAPVLGKAEPDPAVTEKLVQLMDKAVGETQPDEEACRRYYRTHPGLFSSGAQVHVRHILFAVMPGVDVNALRRRAEEILLELRCANDGGLAFIDAAKRWSNCPSAIGGGDLDWLSPGECAPEIDAVLFGDGEQPAPGIGVMATLVRSRFGLHIFEILARETGSLRDFAQVSSAIQNRLRQQQWINGARRCVQLLTEAQAVREA